MNPVASNTISDEYQSAVLDVYEKRAFLVTSGIRVTFFISSHSASFHVIAHCVFEICVEPIMLRILTLPSVVSILGVAFKSVVARPVAEESLVASI